MIIGANTMGQAAVRHGTGSREHREHRNHLRREDAGLPSCQVRAGLVRALTLAEHKTGEPGW